MAPDEIKSTEPENHKDIFVHLQNHSFCFQSYFMLFHRQLIFLKINIITCRAARIVRLYRITSNVSSHHDYLEYHRASYSV